MAAGTAADIVHCTGLAREVLSLRSLSRAAALNCLGEFEAVAASVGALPCKANRPEDWECFTSQLEGGQRWRRKLAAWAHT
jgi:hypothetical protein